MPACAWADMYGSGQGHLQFTVSMYVSLYARATIFCHETDGEHNENMHVPLYVSMSTCVICM